jgi:hypothetical protein
MQTLNNRGSLLQVLGSADYKQKAQCLRAKSSTWLELRMSSPKAT